MWLFACGTPSADRPAAPPANVSATGSLGDFTLKDVDNRSHTLSDYLGRHVIVISFFAMWCEPCKKELVHLDALSRSHRDKGVIVLAISMDEPETQGEVRPFVKQRGLSFPVLLDTEGVASGLFNPRRDAPYSLIIDRRQTISWSRSGYTPGDEKMIVQEVLSALSTGGTPDE
jgi:peroxiredoxin